MSPNSSALSINPVFSASAHVRLRAKNITDHNIHPSFYIFQSFPYFFLLFRGGGPCVDKGAMGRPEKAISGCGSPFQAPPSRSQAPDLLPKILSLPPSLFHSSNTSSPSAFSFFPSEHYLRTFPIFQSIAYCPSLQADATEASFLNPVMRR